MEMHDTTYTYQELYTELENYERKGVNLVLEGSRVSPMQVVTAHMTKENGSYMRDYVVDDDGYLQSLMFVNINGYNSGH